MPPKIALRNFTMGLRRFILCGWDLFSPCFEALEASACSMLGHSQRSLRLLDAAQVTMERQNQRLSEAEFHRLRGELLLSVGASAGEVEASLIRGIDVARSQGAKLWELRAATSLARLWRDQGKRTQAHDIIALLDELR